MLIYKNKWYMTQGLTHHLLLLGKEKKIKTSGELTTQLKIKTKCDPKSNTFKNLSLIATVYYVYWKSLLTYKKKKKQIQRLKKPLVALTRPLYNCRTPCITGSFLVLNILSRILAAKSHVP